MAQLTSEKNKNGNYQVIFAGEKALLRGNDMPFEMVLFDKKTKTAVVRKKAADTRHKLYIIKCKKGLVLPEIRMGARDVIFMPNEHHFFAREIVETVNRYIMFWPDGKTETRKYVYGGISIGARQIIKETTVIEEDGSVTKYRLFNVSDFDMVPEKIGTAVMSCPKESVVPARPAYNKVGTRPNVMDTEHEIADILRDIEVSEISDVRKPNPAPRRPVQAQSTGELQVVVKPIKISQAGTHNDVFVNGERILHNHIGTQAQLFLNNTVLGIYGIVTDNPDLPEKPLWQVYDTGMRPRQFSQRNLFTKKQVYIQSIRPLGQDRIILGISNKMQIVLDQRFVNAAFKIVSKKTK